MPVAAGMSCAWAILVAGFLLATTPSTHAGTGSDALNHVCFETSDQIKLCYAEHLQADSSIPLLIFIPGWTMPTAVWQRQLDYFAQRYSIVAFDPRGQGKSALARSGYSIERRVQDIHELLERFPGRRAVLVGWSLAVLESLAYVKQHGDERLSGLILVDNSIGEGPEPPADASKQRFFDELREDRTKTMTRFVDAIFRQDPGAALKAEVLASALRMDLDDSLRLLSYGKPRTYWKEIVYRFKKPLLYLVTPRWAEQAAVLEQSHAFASVRIFERAGHALFWDEAEAFNQVVETFLERMAGPVGVETKTP